MTALPTTPDGSDDEQFCYRRRPDETPSEAVLSAVSAVSNRNVIADSTDDGVEALGPLYDAIDPDALDAIFAPVGSDPGRNGRVTFSYGGYDVTVTSGEKILISAPSNADGD